MAETKIKDFAKTPPAIAAGAAAGAGVAVAVGLAVSSDRGILQNKPVLVILAGVVVLLLVVISWFLILRWSDRRKAKDGSEQLEDEVAGKKRVDEMGESVGTGIQLMRDRGWMLGDPKWPWFLLVGEPSSGKTAMVKRSGLSFPDGLDKEFIGEGGTYNMDWWFSDDGVILDTAGRLVEKSATASTQDELKALLGPLKKARGEYPINGLLLVIPANTLLAEEKGTLEKRAADAARVVRAVRDTLKIRFPVFVIITKCDYVPGFVDYFAQIDDPELQQQILGWSRPGEEPSSEFDPREVDEAFEEIRRSLVERRPSLLDDPINTADIARSRLDQVSSLYLFPSELASLAEPLKIYLDTIFGGGRMNRTLVFLRGIYLTSALQTNQALDRAWAQIMGMTMKQMYEKGLSEPPVERSVFLKDLFVRKVLVEKGLVMPTGEGTVAARIRKRQKIIYGSIAAACLIVGVVSLWSWHQLRESIPGTSRFWTKTVGEDPLKPSSYHLLYRPAPDASFIPGPEFNAKAVSEQIPKAKDGSLKPGPIFAMASIGSESMSGRHGDALEKYLRAAVIRPLTDATGVRLNDDKVKANWAVTSSDFQALEALLKFVAASASGSTSPTSRPAALVDPKTMAQRMLKYVLSDASDEKAQVVSDAADFLNERSSLMSSSGEASALLNKALDRFGEDLRQELSGQDRERYLKIAAAAAKWNGAQDALLKFARETSWGGDAKEKQERYARVEAEVTRLDEAAKELLRKDNPRPENLRTDFASSLDKARQEIGAKLNILKSGLTPSSALLRKINTIESQINSEVESIRAGNESNLELARKLMAADDLAPSAGLGAGRSPLESACDVYKNMLTEADAPPAFEPGGKKWTQIDAALSAAIEAQASEVDAANRSRLKPFELSDAERSKVLSRAQRISDRLKVTVMHPLRTNRYATEVATNLQNAGNNDDVGKLVEDATPAPVDCAIPLVRSQLAGKYSISSSKQIVAILEQLSDEAPQIKAPLTKYKNDRAAKWKEYAENSVKVRATTWKTFFGGLVLGLEDVPGLIAELKALEELKGGTPGPPPSAEVVKKTLSKWRDLGENAANAAKALMDLDPTNFQNSYVPADLINSSPYWKNLFSVALEILLEKQNEEYNSKLNEANRLATLFPLVAAADQVAVADVAVADVNDAKQKFEAVEGVIKRLSQRPMPGDDLEILRQKLGVGSLVVTDARVRNVKAAAPVAKALAGCLNNAVTIRVLPFRVVKDGVAGNAPAPPGKDYVRFRNPRGEAFRVQGNVGGVLMESLPVLGSGAIEIDVTTDLGQALTSSLRIDQPFAVVRMMDMASKVQPQSSAGNKVLIFINATPVQQGGRAFTIGLEIEFPAGVEAKDIRPAK